MTAPGTSLVGLLAMAATTSCGAATASPPAAPSPTSTPPGCTPRPCASGGGITVLVAGVDPSYAPSPRAGATADPTLRLVLVRLRMTGDAAISLPPTALRVRTGDGRTTGVDLIDGGEACEAIGAGLVTSARGSAGVTGVCFDVGAGAAGGLTLLIDAPGGAMLSIPLPAG